MEVIGLRLFPSLFLSDVQVPVVFAFLFQYYKYSQLTAKDVQKVIAYYPDLRTLTAQYGRNNGHPSWRGDKIAFPLQRRYNQLVNNA